MHAGVPRPLKLSRPIAVIPDQCLTTDNGHTAEHVWFKIACQLCCSRYDDAMQRHFIVSSFQGVDEGTALEGDTTSILANVRVRVHALDRHRQFECYPVVWLPY